MGLVAQMGGCERTKRLFKIGMCLSAFVCMRMCLSAFMCMLLIYVYMHICVYVLIYAACVYCVYDTCLMRV